MKIRAWATIGFALTCACSGQGDDISESTSDVLEQRLVRHFIERTRGFRAEEVVFRDERVVIDGDVIMLRSELLEDIAAAGFVDAPTAAPQGYYYEYGGLRSAPQGPSSASNGRFRFASNVPETWRAAFRAAFAQWSNASADDCVSFAEGSSTTAQITISVGDAGTADDGNPAEASSSFPRGSRPGSTITIGTGSANEPDANWRLHTALHEIGHALGFTHPWNNQGFPIIGTATNQSTGCCWASYFTVMDYYGDTALRADDITSLAKVLSKISGRCNF